MANKLQKPPYQEVGGTYVFSEWLNKVWAWLNEVYTELTSSKDTGETALTMGFQTPPSTGQEGWQDLLAAIDVKGTGVNDPTWETFITNISAYRFGINDECWFYIHLPHDYKWGTPIYPHVHWSTVSATTANLTWNITYSYARGYGIDAFPATSSISITQAGSGVANRHMIAEPAEGSGITLSTAEPDGLLLMRLKLTANSQPTDPFVFFCDLHYYSDGTLTHERNRSFTKHRD